MRRTLLVASLLASACVKEISSEERLERELRQTAAPGVPSAEELAKISCQDVATDLAKAREVNRPEADRVSAYIDLLSSLQTRRDTFETAMRRNPDLAYQDGNQAIVTAQEGCVQQTADVKVEFERYVRELVDVPTVQEIKGGRSTTVARLDFDTLRRGIELLNADDREQLLQRVEAAESKLEAIERKPRRR